MRRRKRITKRDEAVKEGIPVAKLGAEFEWIDEKLKVGLEAYPTFKRPLGKAEISMMLALNMYYDDITEKWKVMDSIDISTVKNLARYYLSAPPALTTDQFAYMRLDKNQRLEVKDVGVNSTMESTIYEITVVAGATAVIKVIESADYLFDNIILLMYDTSGAANQIQIKYMFPDNTYETIYETNAIAATHFDFYKIKSWGKIYINTYAPVGSGYKLKLILRKYHKYYP